MSYEDCIDHNFANARAEWRFGKVITHARRIEIQNPGKLKRK